MRILTFFIVLIISVVVYAENPTEARLPFLKSKVKTKAGRNLANVNAVEKAVSLISDFSNLKDNSSNTQIITPSFNDNSGAFTRADKRKIKTPKNVGVLSK